MKPASWKRGMDHLTRRRLLALAAGLTGLSNAGHSLAQMGSEPPCTSSLGNWDGDKASLGIWAKHRNPQSLASDIADAVKLVAIYFDDGKEYNFKIVIDVRGQLEVSEELHVPEIATSFYSVPALKAINKGRAIKVDVTFEVFGDHPESPKGWERYVLSLSPTGRGYGNAPINFFYKGMPLFKLRMPDEEFSVGRRLVRDIVAKSESNKCCFLTTACCNLIGLPDNCFELRALRSFRDGPLRSMPDGQTYIDDYYRIAPPIAKEIEEREDYSFLARLYATRILPAALLAHLGFRNSTLAVYRRMVLDLQRRYAETVT